MEKNIAMKVSNWREDEDGRLRVTANVLCEGVFGYKPEELPEEIRNEYATGEAMQYIPVDEFSPESLLTLEGKPLVTDSHEWQEPDKAEAQDFQIGAVAGSPVVQDGFITADFVVYDKTAIDAIKSKKLAEVSAGYRSDLEQSKGEWNGKPYDFVQRNIRFNHVLLVPSGMSGRCGHDVRILNMMPKPKETTDMTIEVKIGNATLQLPEPLAEQVKNAIEEVKKDGEKEMEAKNHEIEAAKTELGEIKGKLAEAAALVEKYEKEEYAEEVAEKRLAEKAEVAEVENAEELPEEEKKKVAEAKTMNAKRDIIIAHVANAKKLEVKPEEKSTVWKMLVANAKNKPAKVEEKQTETKHRTPPIPVIVGNANADHPVFKRP